MCILHMCVDVTLLPSVRDKPAPCWLFVDNGHSLHDQILHCSKSVMASFIFSGNAAQAKCCRGGVSLDTPHFEEPVFDVMTVLSSSSGYVEHADII
jgi:hypothetical protein